MAGDERSRRRSSARGTWSEVPAPPSAKVADIPTSACECRYPAPLDDLVARTGWSTPPPNLVAPLRPGRASVSAFIDLALAPFTEAPAEDQMRIDQLKRDLAIVVSAEALFILTDQCGLREADAIDSAVPTATTLTKIASNGRSQTRSEPVSKLVLPAPGEAERASTL